MRRCRSRTSRCCCCPEIRRRFRCKFGIHHLNLQSAGNGVPMKYDAEFTNAKPPGQIHSVGTFGPWSADEPGDTPLTGDYTFENADLGVFNGIAGILHSKGTFEGTLDTVNAHGEASVPDFRLEERRQPSAADDEFRGAGGRHQWQHDSETGPRHSRQHPVHDQRRRDQARRGRPPPDRSHRLHAGREIERPVAAGR